MRENIITLGDASIQNLLVDNAAKAKSEADWIEAYYLEITGGKTYAELVLDDPNREIPFQAVQLRRSFRSPARRTPAAPPPAAPDARRSPV